MDRNAKNRLYLTSFMIFSALVIIGVYLVLSHKVDNVGYAVVPLVIALIFSILHRQNYKKMEEERSGTITNEVSGNLDDAVNFKRLDVPKMYQVEGSNKKALKELPTLKQLPESTDITDPTDK